MKLRYLIPVFILWAGMVLAQVRANLGVSVAITTAASTRLATANGVGPMYVTGYGLTLSTTAATAQTVQFVYGSPNGGNCGTGRVVLTGAMTGASLATLAGINSPTVLTGGGGVGQILPEIPSGNDLCLLTTGTQAVSGWVAVAR